MPPMGNATRGPVETISLPLEEEKKEVTEAASPVEVRATEKMEVHEIDSAGSDAHSDEDAADAEPRRSGRKRTSTTMKIQGHTVKVQNNYVLKGLTYSFGAFDADVKKPSRKTRKISSSSSAKSRTPSATVVERMRHNDIVKARMASDAVKRMKFMSGAFDDLEPFIDEKVKARLRHYSNVNANSTVSQDPKEDVMVGCQPDIVTTEMRDYQMIGLDWMVKMHLRGLPMILGDEMGLGKTLQTISLISYLKEKKITTTGPSLVICPLSVLYSWCSEVEKHAKSLKYFRLHASDANEKEHQRSVIQKDVLNYDIIITTYEMAKSTHIQSLIRNTYFNLCVLDEGHVIKSTTTDISEKVRKIHSQNKLILTGTPLQNNLVELYSILNYLYPEYFTTPVNFANAFDIGQNRIDPDMLLKANKLLANFMLRRLKDEVEKLMPKKLETKILCPLSSAQVFWYKGFLMNQIKQLAKLTEEANGENSEGTSSYNMLRNLVMQLRKTCLHPYLFDFAEGGDIEKTSVEELVATSGKLAVLDMVLRSLFQNGNRTVIFSQFTRMLDILEDYCVLRGWKFCRFDGGTPRAQRNHLINQFNAPGSDIFIFLMSTRSGGLGINLQTADTCILYDSDWNPQPDLQAMARVHRIGQKKTVHVYRLVSNGTVEERVLERAEKKLYLDQMVNRGGSSQAVENEGTGLSSSELLASLRFGSNAVFHSSNELPTDDDISRLTDRSRSEDTSDGLLKGGATSSAKDFDKDKELTGTRTFEGVDFSELLKAQEQDGKPNQGSHLKRLKQEWKEVQYEETDDMGRGKRRKKSRIVNMNGMGSGYGNASVPVLAMNNYDLENGEPSVWRETKKIVVKAKEKRKHTFENQDFCQACGDGGELMLCPSCPVSVHAHCCGISVKNFLRCSHHRCTECGKTASGAGGLLYPCQSCPLAFCGDCLPEKDVRFLGIDIPRFGALGFSGRNNYHYIHCSKQCEHVAKVEFGFKEEDSRGVCPDAIDVTYAFGSDALGVRELATKYRSKGQMDVCVPAPICQTSPRKSP